MITCASHITSLYITAMIVKEAPKIAAMLATLIVGKASIITALSLAFGMSFANSQLSGLLLAQGGELNFTVLAFPTPLFFVASAQYHIVAPLCRTRGIRVCSTGHCGTKWTH